MPGRSKTRSRRVTTIETTEREALADLYAARFSPAQRASKDALWDVLVKRFLQRHVPAGATVVDIAGGYGEFLDHVVAERKVLVDVSPGAQSHGAIEVVSADARMLQEQPQLEHIADVVFVSNFFEHLKSSEDLVRVLNGIRWVLKPGGTLLVIQPNFRHCFREYYDFLDHALPVTDRSLSEALAVCRFTIAEMIPQFLPFTTKGRPSSPLLLRAYLALPFAWRFFGAQMFVRATSPRN